jgi:hypothetical protein
MTTPNFIPEYRRHIDEETRALQQAREPKIIPSKQMIQSDLEPEAMIQPPEVIIKEPDPEPKELIELRRMYLAGETDMSEEMYIRQTEGLIRWWVETGASQQQN